MNTNWEPEEYEPTEEEEQYRRSYACAMQRWPDASHEAWDAFGWLRAEGHSFYRASVMAGLADPDDGKDK